MNAIDDRRFREVLGHFPTGVALVTAVSGDGEPVGMVVGSFTSVSLDPPLVAYFPTTASRTFARLRESDIFCINVLSADQEGLCRRFASQSDDKWSGVGWQASPGGAPILEGAVAWIECTRESITEAGDHYLVMGRVADLDVLNPVPPLLFFQGGYGRFTLSSLVAASSPDLVAAIRMAEIARDDIEGLSRRAGVACDVIAAVGPDLVFVGAATSGDAPPSSPTLGTRIPLIAPLGEQYVAWAGHEAAQRWMDRSGITDADARSALVARLVASRERGWSLSRIDADEELDVYESLREYSDGDLTPAQERALRDRITRWSQSYEPVSIDDDALYDAHSVVVPVLDSDQRPLLVIRLVSLPRPVLGRQIMTWVEQLQACAAEVGPRIEAVRNRSERR